MWHRASPLRGSIPLQYPADAPDITALTCTAPGQCTALGAYATSANSQDSVPVDGPLFEAVQLPGVRGHRDTRHRERQRVPGLAAVHSRDSAIHAVSCQPHRGCSSIGDYLGQDRRLFTSSRP